MTFDFSPWEKTCDFVFVDANHSEPFVRKDTENTLKMIRPGGVILWHDYAPVHPGVQKVLDEFSTTYPIYHIEGTCLAVYFAPSQGFEEPVH